MELGVNQMCQAAVELVSSTDDPSCYAISTLKTIGIVAIDDPASMALQPSTPDETKACTNAFAESLSSERRILRI